MWKKPKQPNNPAQNHRYDRTQHELPPGSCFSHAVFGWWPNTSCDMWGHSPQLGEENCGWTKSSLLPSTSQNWGRFTNKILRPFQNLLSTYFTKITPWNAPILHHCKTSQALWLLCKTEHSYVWTILFMYAFISPHLFLLSSVLFPKDWTIFTQSVIHVSLLLRKMPWTRNRWNFRSKEYVKCNCF